jgi:integrase
MAALADADMKGLRDRAILLLGFAGAFRRSELVALDATDLEFCEGGMRVHIRRSKTDQEGAGIEGKQGGGANRPSRRDRERRSGDHGRTVADPPVLSTISMARWEPPQQVRAR